jgi:tight adherence protein B
MAAQAVTSLIYVLIFAAMVLVVQSIAGIVFSSRDRAERTNRRLTMLASGMNPSEVYATLVRRPLTGPGQNVIFLRWYDRLALYYRQAGLEGSPLRALSLVGAASLGLWLVSFLFLRSGGFAALVLNIMFALPASVMISSLVFWVWLSRKRAKRLKQLEEQMPLALDVVNRALRAGHPVVSAVRLAGEELGDPIGSEFGLIVDETTYGFEFREALVNFARRTGSPDAHFFAVSIGVQSETGGNLAEILEGLAAVIRSRGMLAKKVKALSSEGRASATLLSVLPALLISFMLLTRPTYYTSKFSDPVFWPVAGGVFVAYLVGLVAIRRIINFKY